jgi:hypothetical protein
MIVLVKFGCCTSIAFDFNGLLTSSTICFRKSANRSPSFVSTSWHIYPITPLQDFAIIDTRASTSAFVVSIV